MYAATASACYAVILARHVRLAVQCLLVACYEYVPQVNVAILAACHGACCTYAAKLKLPRKNERKKEKPTKRNETNGPILADLQPKSFPCTIDKVEIGYQCQSISPAPLC